MQLLRLRGGSRAPGADARVAGRHRGRAAAPRGASGSRSAGAGHGLRRGRDAVAAWRRRAAGAAGPDRRARGHRAGSGDHGRGEPGELHAGAGAGLARGRDQSREPRRADVPRGRTALDGAAPRGGRPGAGDGGRA